MHYVLADAWPKTYQPPDLEALFVGGIPGGPELLIVLVLAVLLFGASKIPKLARASGEAIGEFQKGRAELENELDEIRDPSESAADAEPATDSD